MHLTCYMYFENSYSIEIRFGYVKCELKGVVLKYYLTEKYLFNFQSKYILLVVTFFKKTRLSETVLLSTHNLYNDRKSSPKITMPT